MSHGVEEAIVNVRKLLPLVIIKETAHSQQPAAGEAGRGLSRLTLACPHALNNHQKPGRRVNDETDSAAYTAGFKVRHRRVIEADGDTWQPLAPCVSPTACVCSCVRARGSQPLLLFMYTHVYVVLRALFISNMLSIYPQHYMNAHRQRASLEGEGDESSRQAGAGRGVGSS